MGYWCLNTTNVNISSVIYWWSLSLDGRDPKTLRKSQELPRVTVKQKSYKIGENTPYNRQKSNSSNSVSKLKFLC